MASKKKEQKVDEIVYKLDNLELTYQPSKYQEAIFEFIRNSQGNLVIEASAGSGKTTVLVNILRLLDAKTKKLFCAFNTDIVKELKRKTKGIENVDVRTMHSLGNLMILRNLNVDYIPIVETKYKEHIYSNIGDYTNTINSIGKKGYMKYVNNVSKLVDFARYNLADSVEEINILSQRHDIDIINDEAEVVLAIMDWGKENLESIDYTDMVWLPNVLHMKPLGLQFDFILLDESQDFSIAQRELILRCQKMGTRYVFVGDSFQAIYSFASASPESFQKLKELPNTTCLPLSISYRCPKKVVKLAQTLVESIEYKEDAIDGNIIYNAKLEDVKDGDMILCRNNAPLMKVYNDLIRMGRKCFIRGKDIGNNLKKIIKDSKQELLNSDLKEDGLFIQLYDQLFNMVSDIMRKTNLDKQSVMNMSIVVNKLDVINALYVLSENLTTAQELMNRIDIIFSDRKKNEGIALSTIHKAKGLEAENVYIACRSLMPSPSATQEWEIIQEKNLIYVAYTRAKNTLGFLDEKDFQNFTNTTISSENLKFAEYCVNTILGRNYSTSGSTYIESRLSNYILSKSSTIQKPIIGNNKVLMNKPRTNLTNKGFSNLNRKRKINIK